MKTVWVVIIDHYVYGDLNSVTPHVFSTEEKAKAFIKEFEDENHYCDEINPSSPYEETVK